MDPNKFNVGHYANFTQVFGSTKLLWGLPVFTGLGDGVHFPLRNDERINQSLNKSNNNQQPIMSMKTVLVQPLVQSRSLDVQQSINDDDDDDERRRILMKPHRNDNEHEAENEISQSDNGASNVSLSR